MQYYVDRFALYAQGDGIHYRAEYSSEPVRPNDLFELADGFHYIVAATEESLARHDAESGAKPAESRARCGIRNEDDELIRELRRRYSCREIGGLLVFRLR